VAQYSAPGDLLSANLDIDSGGESWNRDVANEYDARARVTKATTTTDEFGFAGGPQTSMVFTYKYIDGEGLIETYGPDGTKTVVQRDMANRVTSVTRSQGTSPPIMSASYTYWDPLDLIKGKCFMSTISPTA
jgi:hypothetical protein